MTLHRHSSVSPELRDAASPAPDQVLFQDGRFLHLDFQGVDIGLSHDEPMSTRPARQRGRARIMGRGGLVASFIVLFVIGGAFTALVLNSDCDPGFDFGSFLLGADPAEIVPRPTATGGQTNRDDASPWAAAAGKATPICPVPALEDDKKSRLVEIRKPLSADSIACLNKVREQLQIVESQRNGCEVALNLMKDGKSVFSGFVPELADTGLGSHKVFQARIAELELKRKSLLAKFTPKSREVRTVDEEIAAVRESFKECLAAYMAYLDQRKAYLIARRAELQRGSTAITGKRAWPIPGPSARDAIGGPPRLVPGALSPRPEKPLDAPKGPSASLSDGVGAVRSAATAPRFCALSGPVAETAGAPQSLSQTAGDLLSSLFPVSTNVRFAWEWVSGTLRVLLGRPDSAGACLMRADATAFSPNELQPSDVTPW